VKPFQRVSQPQIGAVRGTYWLRNEARVGILDPRIEQIFTLQGFSGVRQNALESVDEYDEADAERRDQLLLAVTVEDIDRIGVDGNSRLLNG
jgi:hypothetical protein